MTYEPGWPAQLGQLSAPWVSGRFLAGWDLSPGAFARGLPEPGSAWDALSPGAKWELAGVAGVGPSLFAALPEATSAVSDFAAGWSGRYAPSRANTAGVFSRDVYQTVVCPPWEGQCG